MTQFVLDMLESGLICSKSKWRSTVEAAVKGMQTAKWHMLCMMYKRVNLVYFPEPARLQWCFACKERPGLVKKCRILISLLAGELNLGCGKGRHIRRSSLCQLCESYVEETISHFLLVVLWPPGGTRYTSWETVCSNATGYGTQPVFHDKQ
jgi:hypothetical protein